MRLLCGFGFALLLSSALFAQSHTTTGPAFANPAVVRGGFGNVVFPGGTPSTVPGVQRNFGNIVFPGGEGPAARVNGHGRGRSPAGTGVLVPYAYPVYVGSGVNDSYVGAPEAAAPPPPQQPNVVVVYAPPQQTANPVIINVNPKTGEATVEPAPQAYMAPMPQPAPVQQYTAPEEETPNYLIALKDHTIYSALAYWVDKDTLHYFTAGNVHNQVSLSLVDRPLTDRLNKESGHEVKLPAQAQ